MTTLDQAIVFCGSFEAELLVRLMMEHWNHPKRGDAETLNEMVEYAAEALQRSKLGETLIDTLEPAQMNFVAAVWYAEECQLDDSTDPDTAARRRWLEAVRRSLPSCFCDPDNLA